MDMREINREKRLCTCCMQEHEVKTVCVREHTSFKNVPVDFEAVYFYCDAADELYVNERQLQENDTALKDAYRRAVGLLTSQEIHAVRAKYGITQHDLCTLLGWGAKTITRYESHQVQDKAHDTILKKLSSDPEWFLSLLAASKHQLSEEAYRKYLETAMCFYEKAEDRYLRKSIEAKYARFQGQTSLSLDKVVDVIRYFAASPKITSLYKVKLMKLMWYADALSYKRRGRSMTGLMYQALPMGAVPIGHDSIIHLKGVPCEEVDMGETYAYHFCLRGQVDHPFLDEEECEILDTVVEKLGRMTKDEIVEFMHREQAYMQTAPRAVISF